MKTIKLRMLAGVALAATLFSQPIQSLAQTNLNFNGVSANVEGAIRLSWNSTSNEIYEVDYADSLIDTNTGTITWNVLYTDYPSQGTNTFIGDFGNYFQEPPILHPSKMPMRFYRIALTGTNTANAPTASITSPTNSATVSGNLTVTVNCTSDFPIQLVKLYVDGQEMPASADGTNFVINTCEWPNGVHTLFATVKTESDFSGIPNISSFPVFASSASPYVNVTFDNLITRISFSEPFFDPSVGQTQHVSAVFAANVNWTLQIQDADTNTVRTATGSGGALSFDWDGTGNGGTNIPNGNYTYLISALTNGLALPLISGGDGDGGGSPPSLSFVSAASLGGDSTELWAISPNGSGNAVPLALYPPGYDTNDFTIFEAPLSWRPEKASLSSSMALASSNSGGSINALDANTPTGQDSRAPVRPPPPPRLKGLSGRLAWVTKPTLRQVDVSTLPRY